MLGQSIPEDDKRGRGHHPIVVWTIGKYYQGVLVVKGLGGDDGRRRNGFHRDIPLCNIL